MTSFCLTAQHVLFNRVVRIESSLQAAAQSCVGWKQLLEVRWINGHLDWNYFLWDNNTKPIKAENVVPLHYLGSYFDIRGLRKETQSFCKKTMTSDEADIYLEHIKIFRDDKAYEKVDEACCSSIRSIGVDSSLMEISDAKSWLAVLNENKGEHNSTYSTLISSFCSKKRRI